MRSAFAHATGPAPLRNHPASSIHLESVRRRLEGQFVQYPNAAGKTEGTVHGGPEGTACQHKNAACEAARSSAVAPVATEGTAGSERAEKSEKKKLPNFASKQTLSQTCERYLGEDPGSGGASCGSG